MTPNLDNSESDSILEPAEVQEPSDRLNDVLAANRAIEDLQSTYSRYYLHFGVKAAALAMFSDEVLKVLKTGSSDISKIAERFQLRGDPLSIEMLPLKMILPIPDRAFEISNQYWGSLVRHSADRLPLLPSDFISALGVGIAGQAEEIPSQVFRLSWQYRDLQQPEKASGLLVVAESVWKKCKAKLDLPGLEWAEDPVRAAQIQLVDNFFESTMKSPESAYYLERGRSFLSSLKREAGGRIGYPAGVNKISRDESKVEVKAQLKVDTLPNLSGASTVSPKSPPVPVSSDNVAKPESTKAEPISLSSYTLPNGRQPSSSGPAKLPVPPVVERIASPSSSSRRIEDRKKIDSSKEKRVFPKIAMDKIGSWSLNQPDTRTLLDVVITAYRYDQFMKIKLLNGEKIQGVVVFGAQRHDFFTLIDERNEQTTYPKFAEIKSVEIFSQQVLKTKE